jgi:hypothetical protein
MDNFDLIVIGVGGPLTVLCARKYGFKTALSWVGTIFFMAIPLVIIWALLWPSFCPSAPKVCGVVLAIAIIAAPFASKWGWPKVLATLVEWICLGAWGGLMVVSYYGMWVAVWGAK